MLQISIKVIITCKTVYLMLKQFVKLREEYK